MKTRRRSFLLLFVLLFPVLSCAEGLLLKNGDKVAFLGDSITQFGWENPGGYVRLVVSGLRAEGVEIVPLPAGISGNTSRDMLARFDRDIVSKAPDWVALSCGVNDVWHNPGGVSLDDYRGNVAAMADKAQAANIRVAILTATPIFENPDDERNRRLAAYNEFLRGLAVERRLPLADLNAACGQALLARPPAPGTHLLTVDGVHMNPEGNRVMAWGVLRAVGVPEADLPKVQAAWNAIPGAGEIAVKPRPASVPLDFPGYDALKKSAEARGLDVEALAFRLYMRAVRETFQAHQDDAAPNPEAVQSEAQHRFADLVQASTAASAP